MTTLTPADLLAQLAATRDADAAERLRAGIAGGAQ